MCMIFLILTSNSKMIKVGQKTTLESVKSSIESEEAFISSERRKDTLHNDGDILFYYQDN